MNSQHTTPKAAYNESPNDSSNTSRPQLPKGSPVTPISSKHFTSGTPSRLPTVSQLHSPKRNISEPHIISGHTAGMDRHNNNSIRAVSASVKDQIKALNDNDPKSIISHTNNTSTEPQSVAGMKEDTKQDKQLNTMASSSTITQSKVIRKSIPTLQKENAEKFDKALHDLLKKYIPSTLLEPPPATPRIRSSPSTLNKEDENDIDSINNRTPNPTQTSATQQQSILELEVRHAIANAARNVYHAHIANDKKRRQFDFEYARLQETFFGRGSVVAGLMRREAKIVARKERAGAGTGRGYGGGDMNGGKNENGNMNGGGDENGNGSEEEVVMETEKEKEGGAAAAGTSTATATDQMEGITKRFSSGLGLGMGLKE